MDNSVLPLIALLCLGTSVFSDNLTNGVRNTTMCSFEESSCGWTADLAANSYGDHWIREVASEYSYASNRDHTYGAGFGHYISLNPENRQVSSSHTRVSRIISPVFNPGNKYCIQFYYILSGVDAVAMKVYAKEYEGLGYPVKVIQPSTRKWKFMQLELDSEYTSTNFQVVFEGTLKSYRHYSNGDYYYSHSDQQIAVDDVYVTNTGCASIPKCPPDSKVSYSENTVTCLMFNSNVTTWRKGVDSCRALSLFGHHVSIESEDKQKEVVQYIKSHRGSQVAAENGGVWTSGVDIDVEGYWVWSNTQQSLNYTDWKAGQPNNVGNRQDCLVLDYPTEGYTWGDEYCDLKKPSICQITYDKSIVEEPGIIG